MQNLTTKHDVAISFLKEDEGIARQLNDLLSERLTTFVYYDRQKEVAGTDGEVKFDKVFGQESRIVVVLYRASWGSTSWTRIEQTAIRNRGYEDGYDFIIMIPLDDKPTVPKWLPKTSIWVGLDRWGIEGAAAVIEARVQECGGAPREETPLEQVNRIARQKHIKPVPPRHILCPRIATRGWCMAPYRQQLHRSSCGLAQILISSKIARGERLPWQISMRSATFHSRPHK